MTWVRPNDITVTHTAFQRVSFPPTCVRAIIHAAATLWMHRPRRRWIRQCILLYPRPTVAEGVQ